MKLPISWLNEYVSTEGVSAEELADKLLSIGFEVEEIIYTGEGIDRVVVGKILDVKKHEDADKLKICMVDVGTEITTIVTGAPNVQAGDTVPVALDGATLPGGKTIKAAPLRGVMSYGMMCSGSELNVDDSVIEGAEVDGLLILPEIKPGTDIKEVLRLNEYVLDVSVTANRPDCQSVYGLAREVAAVLGRKLKPLNLKYKSYETTLVPSVKVEDEACSRYTCRVIDEVKIEKSPEWMRDRLRMVGVRPINNVVDITNYVLFEVGQPLHAFDTAFVKDLSIVVRKADEGEKITALDEKEYTLNASNLLIADPEKPLAIAGVMGGEYSGINDDTTTVLLEAARFNKGSVRATSRYLGLRSDSSARYEKGVDYMSVDIGRERALALFYNLKAGRITDAFSEDGQPRPKEKVIITSAKQISDLLGITISPQTVTKILTSLGFTCKSENKKLSVTVPLYREDIENYTDLAEEVIRYYGYDNITSTLMPTATFTTDGGADLRQKNIDLIKRTLCGFGAYEISTYSFIGKKAVDKLNLPLESDLRRQIKLLNPLGEEYSLMRTQLVSSMLSVVNFNLSKKNKAFRLFEVGKTYIPESLPLTDLPAEHDVLSVAFVGGDENFYKLKAVATEILHKFGITPENISYSAAPYLHPGISCDIISFGKVICSLGKIHPTVANNFEVTQDVYILEMDMREFISKDIPPVRFKLLPKYQAAERDLAIVVNEETAVGDLIKSIRAADELVYDVNLFDIYRGNQIENGYKSVALSLTLSSPDCTLNDEQISVVMNKILAILEKEFGAKLR